MRLGFRLFRSLWNLTSASAAVLPRCHSMTRGPGYNCFHKGKDILFIMFEVGIKRKLSKYVVLHIYIFRHQRVNIGRSTTNQRFSFRKHFLWIIQSIFFKMTYHQTSNISRTKSRNLNVYRLVLQLSFPNPLKPGVKSRMKIKSEQCWQAMRQLHLSDQQFYCQLRCDLY